MFKRSSKYGLRGVRVGEASNTGPQLSRQRSFSQEGTDGAFLVPTRASVELLDATQEDLEGTQVRGTRKRVINDDDVPVTGVVSAAVPSLMTSRWLLLVQAAPSDFLRSGPDGRELDNEKPTDGASTKDGFVPTFSKIAASSGVSAGGQRRTPQIGAHVNKAHETNSR